MKLLFECFTCPQQYVYYCKVPKFSDGQKLCCYLSKIQIKRPNLKVFHQKDVNRIANSEDPDQSRSSLIWVCTVCPDLSVRKVRIITVVNLLYRILLLVCQLFVYLLFNKDVCKSQIYQSKILAAS